MRSKNFGLRNTARIWRWIKTHKIQSSIIGMVILFFIYCLSYHYTLDPYYLKCPPTEAPGKISAYTVELIGWPYPMPVFETATLSSSDGQKLEASIFAETTTYNNGAVFIGGILDKNVNPFAIFEDYNMIDGKMQPIEGFRPVRHKRVIISWLVENRMPNSDEYEWLDIYYKVFGFFPKHQKIHVGEQSS